MNNYKDPLVLEWRKVEKVILSCKTREQLRCAYVYWELWRKRNTFWIDNLKNPNGSYIIGKILGMFEAKLTCNGQRAISNVQE